ncbi:hypothetical protein POM88_045414 [Heracleum sosnowskyi]|uniref:Uncharacterized protein n=1 Tax=Heracleum sosnowskyi TaxID=360622 RepID=A0AAD8H7D4_9APIA|nr:hypothetical protein POM88_045414 [Heracleum sosnowskyi]
MNGHGDDLMWEGLACPPLEDDAFNFNTSFTIDDNIFDDPLLHVQQNNIVADYFNEDEETTPSTCDLLNMFRDSVQHSGRNNDSKSTDIRTNKYGKGKELSTLRLVLKVEANHYQKDLSSPDVVAVDRKRKADYDFRSEGKLTRRCGNQGKGKELSTAIKVLNLDEALVKAFLAETKQKKVEKRNIMDCSDCRPMQQKDTNKLAAGNKGIADHTSQLDVVEKPKIDDYDSKFQATRHKLHEGYQRDREFKQKRQIQLIDFQISVTKRSRFNAKSKEKPSLRQKLMAMGTRKSNKKFPFTSLEDAISKLSHVVSSKFGQSVHVARETKENDISVDTPADNKQLEAAKDNRSSFVSKTTQLEFPKLDDSDACHPKAEQFSECEGRTPIHKASLAFFHVHSEANQ